MKNAFLSLIAMMIFSLSAGCQMDQSESASSESTAMTSQQVIEFLDELFMEELQESPQYMTYLGMRERYDEWDDNSDQARDKSLEMTRNHLQQVMKIDLSNVDASAKLSVKMFIEQANKRLEGDRWRYHSYPVSQMRGVHGTIPSFLINQHLIGTETESTTTSMATPLNRFCSSKLMPKRSKVLRSSGSTSSKLSNSFFCFGAL